MKIAIITDYDYAYSITYSDKQINQLKDIGELFENVINSKNLKENLKFLKETDYIFSTWGMPRFSCQEIKDYFPNLKAIFYSAGSVQSFAKEFLECGIRVFSAWKANAIPVAEFTTSQIILASKGYFHYSNNLCNIANVNVHSFSGMYENKIGICGAGAIGSLVCKKLKDTNADVYVYDKYLSEEKIEQLGAKKSSLQYIFKNCDVISNHLANKAELNNIFTYELFSSMKQYSTFINTGRGAQVDEKGLADAMKQKPTCIALLDVTYPEPPKSDSPLLSTKNIIISPHIAGSVGCECTRMADYMINDLINLLNNNKSNNEVTLNMLKNLA